MRVTAKDLEQNFRGEGTLFEKIMDDLVRSAGRACGIPANAIHWDPRPNAKDGGRDLVIDVGNQVEPGRLLPELPSIWSFKSGNDGINLETLKKEVLPPPHPGAYPDHPKVREALEKGHAYIWCTVVSANQDKRQAMRNAADEIADKLKVNRSLLRLWWQDQLTEEVNRFPNLISRHFPEVAQRWKGVLTLAEWRGQERGLETPWAAFGEREALIERLKTHLTGSESPNVLHIAGLSGVGKTRTVLEACERTEELRGVFYLSQPSDLSRELRRQLEDTERVILAIDECSFEEGNTIKGWFSGFDHIRVVTIGPAARQSAVRHSEIVIVPEPRSEDEVMAVIREPAIGLSEAVRRSIAASSSHDLRLALLLVDATIRTPELQSPFESTVGVWDRLMRLFGKKVGDPTAFRKAYEVLSLTIDVGYLDDHRLELECLATHFGMKENDLLECLNTAEQCGLGRKAGRFFESTPHALAVGLFLEMFYRGLKYRLDEFLPKLPPRLLRRFLERCQELPINEREEVADTVSRTFSEWLGGTDLTQLAGKEQSRVFRAWAEFDPTRGLAWLRKAVEKATSAQLLALDGKSDHSGGWRGRRQLVWLCEHLAGFAEHFADCEAILYWLARYETEPEIGNNSGAIWRSLFWPALTCSELSFDDRFPALLRRLQGATLDDLGMVLGAAFGTITTPRVGMAMPPRTVGGRITPGPWMPATRQQLLQHQRDAAIKVLDAVAGLPSNVRDVARRKLVGHLPQFGYLKLTDALRELYPLTDLPNNLRRELVLELGRSINLHRRDTEEDARPVDPFVEEWEQWQTELRADDLATRVQDLTARESYDVYREDKTMNEYDQVASELLSAPETLQGLRDWFDTKTALGASPFGNHLGKKDVGDSVADLIDEWLRADHARAFVVGYLNGAAARDGTLPARWAASLDAVAEKNPELTALATMTADIGRRGLDRLLGIAIRLSAPASRYLRGLSYYGWPDRLSVADRERVLNALVEMASTGDDSVPETGVQLLNFWYHRQATIDTALVPAAFTLASLFPTTVVRHHAHDWHWVLGLLAPHDPGRVADMVLGVMTTTGHHWSVDDRNIEVLINAALHDPNRVMAAVGEVLLDPKRRGIFAVAVFEGLFEGIGLDAVRTWVGDNGPDTLQWIARHLDSPFLDSTGEVELPPLTRWLLTEHEHDEAAFENFLYGRTRKAVTLESGMTERRRAEMAPFLASPLRRVQEWVEYEIRNAEQYETWGRESDEEDGRV